MIGKPLLKFTLISVAFCTFSLSAKTQNTIVGKWMLIDKGDTSYMVFDKEGYFSIVVKSTESGMNELQTIGGKGFEVDAGVLADFKYTIDTTKIPYQVEAALYLANTDILVGLIPGIFKFNNKSLLVNLYDDSFNTPDGQPFTPKKINSIRALRPKSFDTDTQILTRVQ